MIAGKNKTWHGTKSNCLTASKFNMQQTKKSELFSVFMEIRKLKISKNTVQSTQLEKVNMVLLLVEKKNDHSSPERKKRLDGIDCKTGM